MITALDDQVGRIVAALEKKGMRDNTMIFFASDNGGADQRPVRHRGALRGGARGKRRRGARSQAAGFERHLPRRQGQPATKAACACPPSSTGPPSSSRRVVNEPLHMVDVMPTLLALAGGKGSPDHPFDGKDMWPTLAEGKPSPHDDILINVEAFRGAIRKGNWKLVKIAMLPGKTELFDLANDPGEQERRRRAAPRHRPRSGSRGCSPMPSSRSRASGSRRSPSSSARRARRSSIPTSTSTMAACRTRSRSFRRLPPSEMRLSRLRYRSSVRHSEREEVMSY